MPRYGARCFITCSRTAGLGFRRYLPRDRSNIKISKTFRADLAKMGQSSALFIFIPTLNAYHAHHLGPEAHGRREESGLIRLHDGSLPNQISLPRPHNRRPMVQLPSKIENWGKNDHGVVNEEILHTPRRKTGVSIAENDQGHTAQANPSAVGLAPPIIWKRPAVHSLSLTSVVEEQVRYTHDDIVNNTTRGNEVDEPRQDLGRAA